MNRVHTGLEPSTVLRTLSSEYRKTARGVAETTSRNCTRVPQNHISKGTWFGTKGEGRITSTHLQRDPVWQNAICQRTQHGINTSPQTRCVPEPHLHQHLASCYKASHCAYLGAFKAAPVGRKGWDAATVEPAGVGESSFAGGWCVPQRARAHCHATHGRGGIEPRYSRDSWQLRDSLQSRDSFGIT